MGWEQHNFFGIVVEVTISENTDHQTAVLLVRNSMMDDGWNRILDNARVAAARVVMGTD